MKRGRKTWTHQLLSAGTMARIQTWPLSEARPWEEDFYSQMTQSTIRRARGQCARNASSFVLWRVECLFFWERIKIFTAYESKTSTPWRCLQLLCFLILSNVAHVDSPDVSFTHSFFLVVCVLALATRHRTPGTVAILNPSRQRGHGHPVTIWQDWANLHRVSWWRLQSNVMWLSRRGLHEVCHWGHKHPFDQSAIQIEARFHNKWIKWN